jgi:hypothetical protein
MSALSWRTNWRQPPTEGLNRDAYQFSTGRRWRKAAISNVVEDEPAANAALLPAKRDERLARHRSKDPFSDLV